jgi:exodeoxyribonuclease-3
MKLYCWNVNGIRAATQKGFLDWFNKTEPDILCLQETKANKDQLEDNIAQPDGYHAFWNSAEKKGYSGTVTYSKKEPQRIKYELGIDEFDGEGRVIETEYKDFVLFNIYFPNGKRDLSRVKYKLDFCDVVLDRCETLKKEGKNLIICGDYNTAHKEIDLKNWKSNQKTTGFLPEERAWIDKFINHGYVDTFRHFDPEPDNYTWWSYMGNARQKNVGWRIDYFFVNEKIVSNLKDGFILPDVQGSDHCPIGVEVDFDN